MGVNMTMTTRCSLSLGREHLRTVVIIVVLVLWTLLTREYGWTTSMGTLFERV
ncbi:hypothetical protein ACF1AB_31175 [Streptomyces sp. NPDC014846]|uniref:hypothetical protein n=1 Tax=unclassified Streptomyces TaxID=2593676 RepID=UPI0036F93146